MKSVKFKISIRRKLFLANTTLVAMISLFIFIYFPAKREQEIIHFTISKAEAVGQLIANTLRSALLIEDMEALQKETQSIGQSEGLSFVVIHNKAGSVVAHYNLREAKNAFYTQIGREFTTESRYVKILTPIIHENKVLGYVFLALSLSSLEAEVTNVRMAIAIVSIIILIIGSFAVLFISTFVTNPLRNLVQTTKIIADGNLSKRSSLKTGDEFETLSQSFDRMVESLDSANRQLSVLNKDLGRRVETRTEDLQKEIAQHKKTEAQLKESESLFRAIFEKAGIGMVLTDLSGKILEANEALSAMLGYSETELRYMTFQELTHPEDLYGEIQRFSESLKKHTDTFSYQAEKRYIHKNGSILWGKLTSAFIRNEQNIPIFAFGMIEDITPKKKADEDMLNQTRLLSGVAKSTNILLAPSEYSSAIKEALKTLGEASVVDRVYIFENFMGEHDGKLYMRQTFEWTNGNVSAEIDNPILKELAYPADLYKVLSAGKVFTGLTRELSEELRVILEPQGIVSLLIAPIYVHDLFLGFIGFDECTHERIWSPGEEAILWTLAGSIGGAMQREKYETELKGAKEKAVESDRLKSNLLANMSHEFRTPVNGIMGFAELLMEELPPGKRLNMARSIFNSSKRLMATLVSILMYSQIESNKIKPDMQSRKLAELTESALYRYIRMAGERKLGFEYIIESPEIMAKVDSQLLSAILDNLLDNALKFTKTGKITVTVGSQNNIPIIKITDTGIGIAQSDFEIIFQEFRQASEGMGRSYEGNGIGLTIARKLARLMGGEIFIESIPDRGSTFTLELSPSLKFELIEPAKDGKIVLPEFDSTSANADIKYSVLLVEDDEVNVFVAAKYLKDICIVERAADGSTAITMASKKRYDAVLMNINLGEGMDGIETTRVLKQMSSYREVPVLAVTGYAMQGDRERFLAEGFNAYIAKPYDKKRFIDTVRGVLPTLL